MILWCDGPHDVAENMRRDACLLDACEAHAARGERFEPVLRLFAFHPPGITLGHAQDPERVLDVERCRAAGVAWAVRPTGGRAIFHADEWTYSLTAPIADLEWGGSLHAAYDRASRLIQASLVRLGVPAELASRGGATPEAERPGGSPACFASTARHEIVIEGAKLVGSAQRRTAHALLQQGSVLLGPGHLRLADLLAGPRSRSVVSGGSTDGDLPESDPVWRERVRATLARSVRDAGAWLGRGAPLERWADAILERLEPGARRFDAASGAFLLTLPEPASYTSSAS